MVGAIKEIPTPAVLIDEDALDRNLVGMQSICDVAGTELWPHVKTHKMVSILRRQLELGAKGMTCAKLGEAEALLPSGVKRVFVAHSLVDLALADRLAALDDQLDQLILAVTSVPQCKALEALLAKAGLSVPVLMAVDTGLGREGARGIEGALELATKIRGSDGMDLIGIYTHEGQAYGSHGIEEVRRCADGVQARLEDYVTAIGEDLPTWPGCSVTAAMMAGRPYVHAVRPGSYVFGDLSLVEKTGVCPEEDAALSILATVIDRPEAGLALIDAGSKVFSGDKTADKVSARCLERPEIQVSRVSEEHGFLTGDGVEDLKVGQRLRFIPAHVCPVVNLADQVLVVRDGRVTNAWRVDARGRCN